MTSIALKGQLCFRLWQLWLLAALLENMNCVTCETLIIGFGKPSLSKAPGGSSTSTTSNSLEPSLSTMNVAALSGVPGVLSVSILSHRARLALLSLAADVNSKNVIRSLMKMSGVAFVEPNFPVSIHQGERRPNDPLYDNSSATGPHEIVSLPRVWQKYTRGSQGVEGVKVCIVDTGCVRLLQSSPLSVKTSSSDEIAPPLNAQDRLFPP